MSKLLLSIYWKPVVITFVSVRCILCWSIFNISPTLPYGSHTAINHQLCFLFPFCRPARTWTCPLTLQTISIWTSLGQLGQQVLITLSLRWIFSSVLLYNSSCFCRKHVLFLANLLPFFFLRYIHAFKNRLTVHKGYWLKTHLKKIK